MQRLFFIILIALFPLLSAGQNDTALIKKAMLRLDQALLDRDSITLSQLLHPQLTYGHSNGWVQSREEVWNDGVTGKLHYSIIRPETMATFGITETTITARQLIYVEGTVSEKQFAMHLQVLQTWIKTKKGWQLLARQSVKTAANEITK
ncbi:nuclear transport factor 2 family protein [Nostoc ellipsosporum NOK]|jgi:hypothetical protein|nr:nuclear transport factor 2 family protein [Nostoc ellipsosporum NOK]